MEEKSTQGLWQNYTTTRRVIREESKSYEKDVMDKCKEEPKLLFRDVNSKMKNRGNK